MRQVKFGGAFGIVFALCIVAPCLPISLASQESVLAQTNPDRKAEGDQLFNQGLQLYGVSRYSEAIQTWEKALKIYRETQDHKGEANSIGNLGTTYNSFGQYQRAIEYHQQSLALFQKIGDRNGEANSIGNLLFFPSSGD